MLQFWPRRQRPGYLAVAFWLRISCVAAVPRGCCASKTCSGQSSALIARLTGCLGKMMARQESNVVEVLLPFWDSLDKAEKIMRKFGDVGGVNVLNSKTGLLEIAYWDIRAAQKAVDQLGVEKCRFGPPCGNRRVRLPGTASLDHSIIDKISMSEMRVDDRDSSYYTLVPLGSTSKLFYDIRECKRFCDEMENVDPVIESSEKLHNEWVEQAVDWRSLGASNNWWGPPGGTPGVWKAEEVGMTSIAEEDENSERLCRISLWHRVKGAPAR
eukprot:Skav201483  [mRNA]  locus=scaffold828:204211:211357:- [translate_table: standard]